jgi:hypothetical protein
MKYSAVALLLAVALSSQALDSEDRSPFDGRWDAIVSCENTPDALGYVYKFPALVKNGVLHAEKGTKGKAGWLHLEGEILADGSARIDAEGRVGASEVATGHRPVGTQYAYHIEAKFSENSGNGKRVEGRSCSFAFTRTR